MVHGLATVALVIAAAIGAGGVIQSGPGGQAQCRMVGTDKLPADSGGAAHLCRALEKALADRAIAGGYNLILRSPSPNMLIAELVLADGRTLPAQRFGTMDKTIGKASLERFAQSLAEAIAQSVEG